MDLTTTLIGFSFYILIWEKLPEWGTWFNALLKWLPRPIQALYEQWRCPYCVGFWMALALHAATGLWTLPVLENLPLFWGALGPVIGWFLDALATGILILICKLSLDAIGLPAMKAYMMKAEFKKDMAAKSKE